MDDLNKLKAALDWLKAKDQGNRYAIEYMAQSATNDDTEADHMEVLLRHLITTHAAEPAPVAFEPVAWLIGPTLLTRDQGQAETHRDMGSKVTPLYAHPHAAPTDNTALVEALRAWPASEKGSDGFSAQVVQDLMEAAAAALSQPAAPQPTPEAEALARAKALADAADICRDEADAWTGDVVQAAFKSAIKEIEKQAALARGSEIKNDKL